ncbi:flagellar export protein FliJ [Neobacillus sp. SM06]|uniref:flagellar export protein FliJ n=1 Tax=Neobacillus sp. SM06 TaxID=3422492 RepID=UPI003D2CFCEF
MVYQFRFDKILHIKETEKDAAMAEYSGAVRKFEEAANKLYELLKKKEDMELYQSAKLLNGLTVSEIRHHQQFIGNLQKSIDFYQKMVMNARARMNLFQEKLMEKNVEVKKYERIREKDFLHYQEEEKFAEGRQMDEISIQQYMNRGN